MPKFIQIVMGEEYWALDSEGEIWEWVRIDDRSDPKKAKWGWKLHSHRPKLPSDPVDE